MEDAEVTGFVKSASLVSWMYRSEAVTLNLLVMS